ncbi:hypothetical protein VPH35_073671 [Triticum aestivum]
MQPGLAGLGRGVTQKRGLAGGGSDGQPVSAFVRPLPPKRTKATRSATSRDPVKLPPALLSSPPPTSSACPQHHHEGSVAAAPQNIRLARPGGNCPQLHPSASAAPTSASSAPRPAPGAD